MFGSVSLRLATLVAIATILWTAPPALAGDLLETDVHRLTRAELLEDGREWPTSGYLSTSQPDEAVLDAAAAAGFAAVVDLRGKDEDRGIDEQAAVESRGMRYVALPLPDRSDITFENAATLQDLLADVDGPVLLHCFSGNRVGALFALTAKTEGLSSEEALEFGTEAGLTQWEDAVRAELGLE